MVAVLNALSACESRAQNDSSPGKAGWLVYRIWCAAAALGLLRIRTVSNAILTFRWKNGGCGSVMELSRRVLADGTECRYR